MTDTTARHFAAVALVAARATLASEPALPGSRSIATYRRAMLACWRQDIALRSERKRKLAATWIAASDYLATREARA